MKKQFFYAALAIALMSSCSKDNEPVVNPNPDEGNDKVAIELGVQTMGATITTRGTGFAGNQATDGEVTWDQQPLQLLMVKKITEANKTLTKATEEGETGPGYIFKGLEFSAPSKTKTNDGKGLVTNSTGTVKYYPSTGAYDFFGFHFDDATLTNSVDLDNLPDGSTSLSYELTIDGTQDIMIAKAALTTEQQELIDASKGAELTSEVAYARAYSSWAARKGVQPIMTFNHLLSRLDFVAKIGEDLKVATPQITVTKTSAGTAYTEAYPAADGYPQPEADNIDNGVYIKSIKVLNPKDKFTVVVADVDDSKLGIATDPAPTQSSGNNFFTLMRKPTGEELTATPADKKMKKLDPINAGYQATAGEASGTAIGDGIMILPGDNSFDMEIELMQYVPVIDPDDATDPTGIDKIYEWKSQKITTNVALTDAANKFEAGKYYTINITVYGFQKIEVTAALAAWQNGGSIDSNPEDDAFKE